MAWLGRRRRWPAVGRRRRYFPKRRRSTPPPLPHFFPFPFVLLARVSQIRQIPTKRGELNRTVWHARAPAAGRAGPARAYSKEREGCWPSVRPLPFFRPRAPRDTTVKPGRARGQVTGRHLADPPTRFAAAGRARRGRRERREQQAPSLSGERRKKEAVRVPLLLCALSLSRARLLPPRQHHWQHLSRPHLALCSRHSLCPIYPFTRRSRINKNSPPPGPRKKQQRQQTLGTTTASRAAP